MKLTRLAVTGALIGALIAVDVQAFADPDAVAAAKAKLDSLSAQVSAIEQEGIEAGAKAEEAQQRLARTEADVKQQEAKVAALSDELGAVAVMQMQQGNMDVTMQLLSSATDDDFLNSLATLQAETERSNASLQKLQNDQARLDVLRADAQRTRDELKASLATKNARLKEYEAKQAEAESVYDRLKAEEKERLRQLEAEAEAQRRAEAERRADAERRDQPDARDQADPVRTSRSESRSESGAESPAAQPEDATPAPAPNGSRVQTVINAAMAQVGKRYVWGTSGPNTFDCSGLTSYAYRQVGISLSRSSRQQYSSAGRRVPLSNIQPGDLVFYYSGPSHVALYIGNGKIVHAANPRRGIRTAGLHSMPISGVRRVL